MKFIVAIFILWNFVPSYAQTCGTFDCKCVEELQKIWPGKFLISGDQLIVGHPGIGATIYTQKGSAQTSSLSCGSRKKEYTPDGLTYLLEAIKDHVRLDKDKVIRLRPCSESGDGKTMAAYVKLEEHVGLRPPAKKASNKILNK